METNNSFQEIVDSGQFDISSLIEAGNIKFIMEMKEADSFHLLIDQVSQLNINISDLPRPRSPFKITTDLIPNDQTEPIVILQGAFMQYAVKASFLSAFAALENFLLVTNICFEIVESLSNNKITDHQLIKAHKNALIKTHQNQSIDKVLQKLGEDFLHKDVTDLFTNLRNFRNCLAHRWGKVSHKDLKQDSVMAVKYFDYDIDEIAKTVTNEKPEKGFWYQSTMREHKFKIDDEIILSSVDCQKMLMTLMKIQHAFSVATLQWVINKNVTLKESSNVND